MGVQGVFVTDAGMLECPRVGKQILETTCRKKCRFCTGYVGSVSYSGEFRERVATKKVLTVYCAFPHTNEFKKGEVAKP